MVKVISLPNILQVLYVLCFTWTRYQVSVYRTIGPLVSHYCPMEACEQNISRTVCARVMIFESQIVSKV